MITILIALATGWILGETVATYIENERIKEELIWK